MIYPRKATTLFPQICENGEVYKNAVSKEESCHLLDLKAGYTFRRLFGDERNKKNYDCLFKCFFYQTRKSKDL